MVSQWRAFAARQDRSRSNLAAMNARNLRRSAIQADWTLRYAEPAEFDDVAALLLRANDAAYCDNLCRLALDPAAQDDCEILVIGAARGRDRGLLGTVTFFPDAASEGLGLPKGWAGLRALAVDPAARGCGLGRRLASFAGAAGKMASGDAAAEIPLPTTPTRPASSPRAPRSPAR